MGIHNFRKRIANNDEISFIAESGRFLISDATQEITIHKIIISHDYMKHITRLANNYSPLPVTLTEKKNEKN